MASAVTPRPADTGKGRNLLSSSLKMEAGYIGTEWAFLLGQSLLLEVVQVIQNARVPSTRTLYLYKWRAFKHWCNEQSDDPFHCNISVILRCLHSLYKTNMPKV